MIKNIKIIDIVTILFIYNIFHLSIKYIIRHLDSNIYIGKSSYFISAFSDIKYAVIFFTMILFFIFNYKKITWDSFNDKVALKIFVMIVSFPIFWEQAFYDYNYYLNTDFNIDKILITISIALIFIHPLFSFILLFIGLTIWNSTTFPLDYLVGAHWIDIRPAYDILFLFISFLILKTIKWFKNINTNIFIFLALTLHASNYFVPGIGKIEISPHGWEWTFLDNINNLFVSSYINGWLGFIDEDIILEIANYMNSVDYIITIGTMLIQLLAIFLLYNRKVSIWMFMLFEVLHFGIIFASGIIFWTWIVVNLGFLYLIKHLSKQSLKSIYNKNSFITFIIIVLLSPLIYRPPILAWWDASVNTVYDIYVTTDDDKIYKINSQDLSPYDTVFAQNNLSYIDKEPTLVNNYGFLLRDLNNYSNSFLMILNKTCFNCLNAEINRFKNDSYEVYKKLEKVNNIDEIKTILKHYGDYNFDKDKRSTLKKFLNIYFSNYNKRAKKDALYKKLGAPYHLYDLSTKRIKGEVKIKNLKIVKSNTWYDKKSKKIVRFDKQTLLEMDIK